MAICIPTYTLASGLVDQGWTWQTAVGAVILGNFVVLVPIALNSHAGTRYGIPFPVLARSSFGVLGANIPALLRGLVACGWFGIQTWIGGWAIYKLIEVMWPGIATLPQLLPAFVGLNTGEFLCFMGFWAMNVGIVLSPGRRSCAVCVGGGARGGHRPDAGEPWRSGGRAVRRSDESLWRRFDLRRRLLGHDGAVDSRLLALRTVTTRPGHRPGRWTAGNDGVVRVHRRRRHERHPGHLRHAHRRSGRAAGADRWAADDHALDGGPHRRHAHDQYRRQHRRAGERIFEHRAAPDQLQTRRDDHGGDRHRGDAVATLQRCRGLHLHLAHRALFE